MPKIFFTADTHFGHANVIEFYIRPFVNAAHMDDELIRNWNAKVSSEDLVYHLGDISFHKKPHTLEILKRLNGTKRLIKGNHDHLNNDICSQFLSIEDYSEIKVGKQKIVLCHFPIESWHGMGYGAWHLHGHTHGSLLEFGKRWDVGVDVWNYAPVSYEELAMFFTSKNIETRDYHVKK